MTTFYAPEGSLSVFRTLLQQGVGVTIETGGSLEDLLCRQWQIDRDYVLGRISTLFLARFDRRHHATGGDFGLFSQRHFLRRRRRRKQERQRPDHPEAV